MTDQKLKSIPNEQYFSELKIHFDAFNLLDKKGVDIFRELDKREPSRGKLVLQAALHRNLKLMDGLKLMLETRNLLCAASIVRMQIDTCMRLNAPLIVPENNREDCFLAILAKDQSLRNVTIWIEGKKEKLYDGYLKDELEKRRGGTAEKYNILSGFIHFDESAFWDSYASKEGSEWRFAIGGEASEVMNPRMLSIAKWFSEYTLVQQEIMEEYKALLPASEEALLQKQQHSHTIEGDIK